MKILTMIMIFISLFTFMLGLMHLINQTAYSLITKKDNNTLATVFLWTISIIALCIIYLLI